MASLTKRLAQNVKGLTAEWLMGAAVLAVVGSVAKPAMAQSGVPEACQAGLCDNSGGGQHFGDAYMQEWKREEAQEAARKAAAKSQATAHSTDASEHDVASFFFVTDADGNYVAARIPEIQRVVDNVIKLYNQAGPRYEHTPGFYAPLRQYFNGLKFPFDDIALMVVNELSPTTQSDRAPYPRNSSSLKSIMVDYEAYLQEAHSEGYLSIADRFRKGVLVQPVTATVTGASLGLRLRFASMLGVPYPPRTSIVKTTAQALVMAPTPPAPSVADVQPQAPQVTEDSVATQQAPQVSETDAYKLFYALSYDAVYFDKDPSASLVARYQSAQNDQQRALIVAAKAMGMDEQAKQAAYYAINHSVVGHQGPEVSSDTIKEGVDIFANATATFNGNGMRFTQEVQSSANLLVDGARDHGLGISDYFIKVYLPHQFTSAQGAGIQIQNTIRSFYGIPANNTVAPQQ